MLFTCYFFDDCCLFVVVYGLFVSVLFVDVAVAVDVAVYLSLFVFYCLYIFQHAIGNRGA